MNAPKKVKNADFFAAVSAVARFIEKKDGRGNERAAREARGTNRGEPEDKNDVNVPARLDDIDLTV